MLAKKSGTTMRRESWGRCRVLSSEEGKNRYAPIIAFTDDERKRAFTRQAVAAIEAFLSNPN
jgi:hypothetical protein